MNIWYHPQLSVRNRRTNRLMIEHDGHYNRMKEVLQWLQEQGHKIIMILPTSTDEPLDYAGLISWLGGCGNVAQNRFSFDSQRVKSALESFKPDVIWTEVPELVANYASITDTPIVASYEHFANDYLLRQIEGFGLATINTVPTCELYYKFRNMAMRILSDKKFYGIFHDANVKFWKNYVARSNIKTGPIIQDKWNDEHFRRSAINILFPSRLSDYTRTKWANFIAITERLLEEGFNVTICNPTEVEKPGKLEELTDSEGGHPRLVFHDVCMSRDKWFETIAQSHIAVILYSFDEFYSVGAIEILAMGVKLITPYSSALADLPLADEQLCFMSDTSQEELLKRIEINAQSPLKSFDQNALLDEVSGEAWALRIFETLEEAVKIASRK